MSYNYKKMVKDFKQFVNENYTGEEMEIDELGEVETPEELKVYSRETPQAQLGSGVGSGIVITPDDYWTPDEEVVGGAGLDIPIDQSEEGGAPPLTPNDEPIDIS